VTPIKACPSPSPAVPAERATINQYNNMLALTNQLAFAEKETGKIKVRLTGKADWTHPLSFPTPNQIKEVD
jgi:hypothetical protein